MKHTFDSLTFINKRKKFLDTFPEVSNRNFRNFYGLSYLTASIYNMAKFNTFNSSSIIPNCKLRFSNFKKIIITKANNGLTEYHFGTCNMIKIGIPNTFYNISKWDDSDDSLTFDDMSD